METLSIRETRRYVGTYQHLDEWTDIGTLEVIGSKAVPVEDDEDDLTEPRCSVTSVIVTRNDGVTDAQVSEALHDTYTQHGCAHEYDCCGCRSYHVTKAEPRTGDLWEVHVASSRNF